jgi:succinyl-diaminopimelate desuccinylase
MADEQLKANAHAFVERLWEDVIADITKLVAIRSVEDMAHATPEMPYGPAPFEALQTAVDIAARMGMDAHNCDGHIG